MKNNYDKKVTIEMVVAVHQVKADLWKCRHKIKPEMTLREVGALIGVKSAQQIKYHLQAMVSMGSIDYIGGHYIFPK